MEKVMFDENYRKAESFIDENAEKWIKEFGLDEERIKDIKSVMTACQFLGVDVATFPGFEELV